MADTVREQILTAFAAKVGAARGDATQPLALWAAGDVEPAVTPYGTQRATIPVSIETVASADPSPLARERQIEALLGELVAAALGGDRTLEELATGMTYLGSEIQRPAPGESVVGVRISVGVRYETALGDPYTLPIPSF